MKTIRLFASLVMLASFPEARNVPASASGICRGELSILTREAATQTEAREDHSWS